MVAVFALNRLKQCEFLNVVAETLTGLDQSQAIGRPFADVLFPKNPGAFARTRLADALDTGEAGEGEDRIPDKLGIERPFAFRVSRLGAPTAPPSGLVIELTDLSGETGTGRALRESEQRLRLAIEATGIGIWDVNAVYGTRRWSPEFVSILGLPADVEPDQDLFASLIHPADRERVLAAYDRAYAPGSDGIYNVEFRIVRANDGAERWVSTTGRVVFDADGRPLRGVGTLSDIHERRANEEALREREERLRVALIAGRMGTWRQDLRTNVQEWDATQYRLFGIEPTVIPTRELFLSLVLPEDLVKVDFDATSVPVATYLDAEFRVRRSPDGAIRWISAQSLVLGDSDGLPAEMVGVNRDITEQKQAETQLRISEERQRLAVEANALGTWDYDMITGEHRWSDQFKALFGLPAEAPADPRLLHPLVDAEQWAIIRGTFDALREKTDDPRITLEYPIRRADDGTRRWLSCVGRVFYDQDGRTPVRAIGVMMDVTDRREAEERQNLIVKELNHRVRNNLAVVQAIVSQTLRMSKPGEAFGRIQERLMSIARTHDFLNRSNWGGVSLLDLLRSELEPHAVIGGDRVQLAGPHVALNSRVALALGLSFHELTTNATKYGSLSVPEGRLSVTWKVEPEGDATEIVIDWLERGGPAARAPRRRGFGSRLIEGSVEGNLHGKLVAQYAREGFECRMTFVLPRDEGTQADAAA